MVGWKAPLLPVARQDGREIEPLPHRVSDEVSEVSLRHELVHRTPQQPALVHVPRTECLGHAPSESSRDTAVEHYSDGLLAESWYGLYAPAGTPAPIIQKLNRSIARAVETDAV